MESPELVRNTPHLDKEAQGLVVLLLRDYPEMDQLMAETIVWDYLKKRDEDLKKSDELEEQECNEAASGSKDESTK